MSWINLLVGIAALVAGRRLFWLFVAACGFLAGMVIAERALADQPAIVMLVVACAAGLVGALVAVFFQWAAFMLAGFLAGAYLGLACAEAFNFASAGQIAAIVGGVIGAILALAITDWAIIILSALLGAAAIVDSLPLAPSIRLIVFVALALVGVAIQSSLARPAPPNTFSPATPS